MIDEFISKIGAVAFDSGNKSNLIEIQSIENQLSMKLPNELKALLKTFKGKPIVFESSVCFSAIDRIPVADLEGKIPFDCIYGLEDTSNGLNQKNKMYLNQIPDQYAVFGESPGGDQLCIEKSTGNVYFWHHEAATEEETLYLIAQNFYDFMNRVEVDSATAKLKDGDVDESESFLDF